MASTFFNTPYLKTDAQTGARIFATFTVRVLDVKNDNCGYFLSVCVLSLSSQKTRLSVPDLQDLNAILEYVCMLAGS